MGSCSLLKGIFPTQGLKLGLLHCRQILCELPSNLLLKELDSVLDMLLHTPKVTETSTKTHPQRNSFLNDSRKEKQVLCSNGKHLKFGLGFFSLLFSFHMLYILKLNVLKSVKLNHQKAEADILHTCSISLESNH